VAEFAPIVFDPNIRPSVMGDRDLYQAAVEKWAAISSVIKVSDDDLGWLFPDQKYEDVAKRWVKDGAALVNVARGPVVDTEALIKELESGRITAALDVTDPEPLPDGHPLWKTPNVIITPHVGGDSQAFIPRGRKLVEEQVARYAAGQPLLHIVAQ
jgi:hypothetical protein